MKGLFLKVAVFACMAAGGLAQTSRPAESHSGECDNAITTAAMRICEASRYNNAQQELDGAYRELMVHLDPGQKMKLRAAQRSWIRFRDASADFQASLLEGGTLAPLVRISSLTEMTKARTQELRREAVQ